MYGTNRVKINWLCILIFLSSRLWYYISVKYNVLDARIIQAFQFKIFFSNKTYEALFLSDSIDIVSTFYRKNLPLNVYAL